MVTEKPMDRAAEPRRPFLLSSVTAKMHTTSCMVRKTSTVVAIPRLMPGCSWKSTTATNQTFHRANTCANASLTFHFIDLKPTK